MTYDQLKHIKDNKDILIQQKRSKDKHADAIDIVLPVIAEHSEFVSKEAGVTKDLTKADTIIVKAVINTTNILDSHGDVHIKGIWKKSLAEAKKLLHLQEHQMSFDKVISRTVKAEAKTMTWKSLGFEYEGSTQALVFESTISKEDNPFMFDQYVKGNVDNHSVGMRYVKIDLAVNSEDKYFKEEKEIWDKYICEVANKQEAELQGYFWAVTEAKVIEGSAVLRGSNQATPTISIAEAGKATSDKIEPSDDTQKDASAFNLLQSFSSLNTKKNP